MTATKAIDVLCSKYGALIGVRCPVEFCQVRCNAAAALTRAANREVRR